jgi:hypothetical protein
MSSVSEASLTSFGTAHREVFPKRAFLFVLPRRVSAERPLASLGAAKKGSGRHPHSVMSSNSETSLTSIGTASPGGDPSLALGVTEKEARGDKKERLGVTTGGLAPIFKTASTPLIF